MFPANPIGDDGAKSCRSGRPPHRSRAIPDESGLLEKTFGVHTVDLADERRGML